MEMKTSVASLVSNQKRRPALLVVAVILLLGLVAFAVYLSSQKTAIVAQQKDFNASLKTLQTQIDDLKKQNVEAAQVAKNWLSEIEKNEVRWSRVLKSLRELVPLDAATQKAKIRFLSYSGSASGKLTLNVETVPAPQPPFADVAELISVFNQSAFFKDAYVPSITRGLSETGNTVLSFIFNVTYLEDANPNAGSASSEDVVVPSSAPKVSKP